MKRIISLLLALMFVLTLAPSASADVLVSPVEMVLDSLHSLDLRIVLAATVLIALGSAAFLWFTRKKK